MAAADDAPGPTDRTAPEVALVSSVRVGPLELLRPPLSRALGVPVRTVGAFSDDGWRAARSGARRTTRAARLRGLLFPLTVRLGPGRRVTVATTNPFWLPTLLALRRVRPLVVLVYDVYPDALTVRWRLPAWLVGAVAAVFGAGLRRADAVVVLGERIGATLRERHRLTRPIVVIPTGADPDDFPPVPEDSRDSEREIVVSYVGNTGSMHDGRTVGAALAAVLARQPRVRAVVATRGDRAEDVLEPLRAAPRVELRDHLGAEEFARTMARTDIALVTLDAAAGGTSVPSKVHPALAAGCAVLAIAPADSDLADLVAASGAGPVVAPGDVPAAAAALERLVTDDALRARHAAAARRAAERFTPAVLAERWAAVLRPLLPR